MDAFILEKLYKEIESIATQKYSQKNSLFEKNVLALYKKFVNSVSELEQEILKNVSNSVRNKENELSAKAKEAIAQLDEIKKISESNFESEKASTLTEIRNAVAEAKSNIEKYRGEKGEKGKDGKNGKDGSPDTPDQIVEKINKSSKLPKFVKVLQQELKNVQRQSKGGGKSGGGGMGDVQHESKNVGVGTTSIETTYPIAANGNAIIKVAYRNMIWHKDIDFTVGANRKTLNLSADAQAVLINSTTIEVTYIRG